MVEAEALSIGRQIPDSPDECDISLTGTSEFFKAGIIQVFGIIDPEFDGKLLNIDGAEGAGDIDMFNKVFDASIFINLFKKLKKPEVAPPPPTP